MKNVFKVALVAVCMMLAGNFAKAQGKIGYIAQDEVITLLPELKTVQTQMQAYSKTWSDQLSGMNETYQKAVKEYQDQEKTMTDAVKEVKQKEIQDLGARIESTQKSAEEKVVAKRQEIFKPILDKAEKAIKDVAKEKSFDYVFDISNGSLLVYKESDNMMGLVKTKLGIL